MLSDLFSGLFDTATTTVISPLNFLLCLGTALILGLGIMFAYRYKARSSSDFLTTLAILPAVVCIVIMMVNGNVGAGVAVAGAFSLVRFRSAPGTAREIGILFLAMGTGLICGMGYLAYAALYTLILSLVLVLYSRIGFSAQRIGDDGKRVLRITVPEDLDYTGVFESLFPAYASHWELTQVKTSNMGSLYKLTYRIDLSDVSLEKEMIDKIRCRNGNLEISVSRPETQTNEL